MSTDPVHFENGSWYFYEETWAHRQGPFTTEAEAREACVRYAQFLNDGVVDPEEERI
jgi:hypothetical protein